MTTPEKIAEWKRLADAAGGRYEHNVRNAIYALIAEVERLTGERNAAQYDAHVMAPWSAGEVAALHEANAELRAEVERLRGCGHCEATFAALEGEQRTDEGHVETVIRLRAEVERLRDVLRQIADDDLPHEKWCDVQSDCGHGKSAARMALGERHDEDEDDDEEDDEEVKP